MFLRLFISSVFEMDSLAHFLLDATVKCSHTSHVPTHLCCSLSKMHQLPFGYPMKIIQIQTCSLTTYLPSRFKTNGFCLVKPHFRPAEEEESKQQRTWETKLSESTERKWDGWTVKQHLYSLTVLTCGHQENFVHIYSVGIVCKFVFRHAVVYVRRPRMRCSDAERRVLKEN